MSTVVVRGAGGTLYEMDEPTSGHALERWAEKIAKGDLVIVDEPVEWVDVGGGAKQLRVVAVPEPAVEPEPDAEPDEADEPKPRRGRPPKAKPTDVEE